MLKYDESKDIFIMHCNSCHKATTVFLSSLSVSFVNDKEIVLASPCRCGAIDFYGLHQDHALLIARFLLKELSK